jgi:hypothetical protein
MRDAYSPRDGRYAINSSGVLVGAGSDSSGAWRGFVYSNGVVTELLPAGWTEAYEYAINDGEIIAVWGATSR